MNTQGGKYLKKMDNRYIPAIGFIIKWLKQKMDVSDASNKAPTKILDIGCGEGYLLSMLQKAIEEEIRPQEDIELIGVDINNEFVERLKKENIKGVCLDVRDIDNEFRRDSIDIVCCTELIEHVNNPDEVIKKVKNILKNKGNLIISTPNLASYYNRILLLFGYQPLSTEVSTKNAAFGKGFAGRVYGTELVGHQRIFTLKAFREFMQFYGFNIVKTIGISYYPPISILRKIISLFPSICGDVMLICENEKKGLEY